MLKALMLVLMATNLSAESIGIANHNPGNIRSWHWQQWRRAVGVDPWHHLRFRTDKDGLEAMKFILAAYDRKGIRKVPEIVNRWVGPKKEKEAILAVRGYMKRVADDMGTWGEIDTKDPLVMRRLAHSIVYAENGKDPYPDTLYQEVFH